ncbi:unnamed protein product [Sphagnum jensenii]
MVAPNLQQYRFLQVESNPKGLRYNQDLPVINIRKEDRPTIEVGDVIFAPYVELEQFYGQKLGELNLIVPFAIIDRVPRHATSLKYREELTQPLTEEERQLYNLRVPPKQGRMASEEFYRGFSCTGQKANTIIGSFIEGYLERKIQKEGLTMFSGMELSTIKERSRSRQFEEDQIVTDTANNLQLLNSSFGSGSVLGMAGFQRITSDPDLGWSLFTPSNTIAYTVVPAQRLRVCSIEQTEYTRYGVHVPKIRTIRQLLIHFLYSLELPRALVFDSKLNSSFQLMRLAGSGRSIFVSSARRRPDSVDIRSIIVLLPAEDFRCHVVGRPRKGTGHVSLIQDLGEAEITNHDVPVRHKDVSWFEVSMYTLRLTMARKPLIISQKKRIASSSLSRPFLRM